MQLIKKIKAGALQYVLVISVIIAIIIFTFISLIFLQQKMTIKYGFAKETVAYTQMGFDYLKGNSIPYYAIKRINFSENNNTETRIEKKHWGIFDLAIVNTKIKNEFFEKVGLLGAQKNDREALYLKDNNQSLVLVGNTKITGKASIPKQGVKRGNISGTSYYGNQLIYGNQRISTNSLPKIKNIDFIKDLSENLNTNSFENFELEDGLNLHQSFIKTSLIYQDSNPIKLMNLALSGNIYIVSSASITVDSSTNLEDVILIAPKIYIEKNVQGNFQAIASKNIEVKSNCNLKYPTALILFEKEDKPLNLKKNINGTKEISQISIGENSNVKGVVLFESESSKTNYDSQIVIKEKATLTGEVYCAKNTELLGSIFGSIYTSNFIIKKAGGIFVNYIYNGVINSSKLPNQYAGLQINKEANEIAKWLN